MWLFGKNNFLSIVQDKHDPSHLLVRARLKGDIEALFPKAEIHKDAGTDYRFRAWIKRADVIKVVTDAVKRITYTNFKNANDYERQGHLMKIWDVMYDEQERRRQDD